jgi:hypothetical protein
MNLYPSWIHRIPEMIEALKLHPGERVDRRTVENLFDLRKTAAFYLLRRLGAERCGKSLVSLPNTVQLASGCVTIKCRDTDYEAMRRQIESTPREPAESENAAVRSKSSNAG